MSLLQYALSATIAIGGHAQFKNTPNAFLLWVWTPVMSICKGYVPYGNGYRAKNEPRRISSNIASDGTAAQLMIFIAAP